jgi:hypothetical protein
MMIGSLQEELRQCWSGSYVMAIVRQLFMHRRLLGLQHRATESRTSIRSASRGGSGGVIGQEAVPAEQEQDNDSIPEMQGRRE